MAIIASNAGSYGEECFGKILNIAQQAKSSLAGARNINGGVNGG